MSAKCQANDGAHAASTWESVLLAGLLLVSSVLPACAAPPVALDMCEMKPVFMDEFDDISIASRSLGTARWIAHTPWNGDFGDAVFTDPIVGGPFSIADGVLRITASKSPEGRWRSGLIAAADASGRGSGTRYGYFEARMQFPPGSGTWPAFWLSSLKAATDPAPSVEIDVLEYYGHMPQQYSSAVHIWHHDGSRNRQDLHWTSVPTGALVAEFHRYGLRVAPDVLTFYLDDKPVWQVATPEELQVALYPMVNLALGSGFPIDKTPNPSTLLVDYVHVYALDPAGRASRCPPHPSP